jgi:hypothetical protein
MKKLYVILALISVVAGLAGQSPERMSYQAIVRNSSGALVSNSNVRIRIQILQNSESGAAVYDETHTTKTNENGLATIEIGGGTIEPGTFLTFADIDWSLGPYFLKTLTDPSGGTTYSIVGTTQLMSVPYALHAKTAENITATITETDPVFGASVAKNITASDTTKWSASKHHIGESYGGGIVFYVYDNGQHGLIAATADLSTGVVWTTDTFQSAVTNSVRDGVNGGITNTERIIMQASEGIYAAQLCDNYQGGNYADWYLPSNFELNLLYLQKAAVGGFADGLYWSSTEYKNNYAWAQDISQGTASPNPKPGTHHVRAIRAF